MYTDNTRELIFPDQYQRDLYNSRGVLPYLSQVSNNEQDGSGYCFNFTLSNGDKSHHGKSGVKFIHEIQEDVIKRTKYVDIAYRES